MQSPQAPSASTVTLRGGYSAAGIPRFDAASDILRRATGWEIVPVPALIPEAHFFAHLAQRRDVEGYSPGTLLPTDVVVTHGA